MTCTSPFRLQGKEGKIYLLPCGQCMACRVSRNREWAARLVHEKTLHKNSAFVTLTFRPEDIPPLDSLSKATLQKFLKRLRKSLGNRKIRYFACGEYGDKSNHAHYHLIIFGLSLSLDDKKLVEDAWPYGFVYLGNVTYSSCRYVTAYILKKITGEKEVGVYGERVPPFALMSKGLGKGYVLKNWAQFSQSDGIMTIDGKKFGLPRYYKNLMTWQDTDNGLIRKTYLDFDKQAIVDNAIKSAKAKLNEYKNRGLIDDTDLAYTTDKARQVEDNQRDLNLRAKIKLKADKKHSI